MKGNIVKLLLMVQIFILIIIIISIYFIYKKSNDSSYNLTSYEYIISDDEKELFEVDNTISQTKNNIDNTEDIDLDVVIEIMATDENIDYIIDNEEAIKLKIKEYIELKNNQFDATCAIYETYQSKKDSDMIAVLFVLDDIKETELIVIIDKENNTIKVKEK